MSLLLDDAAIRSLLRAQDLIPILRRALAEFSSGAALQPVRTRLSMPENGAQLYVMPGALPAQRALAVKLVSVAEGNAARGLPSHLGVVVLIDPSTGEVLALMDARLITEMRTAAVSAAAADALAKRDARVLALLGSGIQARGHLEAMRCVRSFEDVRVWSPNASHAQAFAREASAGGGAHVTAASSAETAVRGADVVVTVTASATPVVHGVWLDPGACVIAVGASSPDRRELDGEALRRARVFVDSRDAARAEAGDILLAERERAIGADHVCGEIGEVFAGRMAGRQSADEITMFKSLGLAIEDAATAKHLYDLAIERRVGTEFRS
jgi:alanine dehydrogenase